MCLGSLLVLYLLFVEVGADRQVFGGVVLGGCLSISIITCSIINVLFIIIQMHDSIDYNILTFIDPPQSFPPSAFDIACQIQSKFHSECLSFLKHQKKFHSCSKAIENKLTHSLTETSTLDTHLREQAPKLDTLTRQLKKLIHAYSQAQQREEFLAAICKFVNMEQARKIMLQTRIGDQGEFIAKLGEVDHMVRELDGLGSELRIVGQIREELTGLLMETVDKMIKGSISDNLIKRITSDFSEPFLRDPKIAAIFLTNLTNHRLNFFRVGLNPLINNINYVQNVTQLYEKITEQWLKMLEEELKIFGKEENPKEIKNITKEVMSRLVAEVMAKMERGIYKLKNLVDISRVRYAMMKLKNRLDQIGEGTWDPLPKLLVKMLIILEEKLEEGAEELEIAKYNIYSLVSYVPIREHLQLIKEAKKYEPDNKDLSWQRGFKRLADSRDPSKQPNNKSLTIFNLNIWYLYSHVMKQEGEMIERAEKMIKESINSIINLNLIGLKKEYESKALGKLFDLCADPQAAKKILYSEINLLGHERLRTTVEKELITRFIQEIYIPMLKQHNLENGLENGEAIELAKKQKINLNKYGKASESLRIFTSNEIKQLLS